MLRFFKSKLSILALLFVSLSSNAAIIFQDDFGTGSVNIELQQNYTNWSVFPPSDPSFVTPDSFDVWKDFPGFNGYAIDLVGQGQTSGTIYSTSFFTFLQGVEYILSVTVGNNDPTRNSDEFFAFGVRSSVPANPEFFRHDINISALTTSLTRVETLMFTPTQTFNGFIFFDTFDSGSSDGDNGGAIVDNVVLQSSEVPEPAALGLLGALALVMFRLRRR